MARLDKEVYASVCPEHCSIATYDDRQSALETACSHNDDWHNGEEVARVVGPNKEELDDFMSWAKDEFDFETYKQMAKKVVNADPWGLME